MGAALRASESHLALSQSIELDELVQSQNPFLIGIRHHSPACAVRMADWLESFGPELILLELPVDFMPWLEWLSHPELQAPVALSASSQGSMLSFYPLADFSPELAAIRWARAQAVPVVFFDLSLLERGQSEPSLAVAETDDEPQVLDYDLEELWDRLLEAPAAGATPEALRSAALLVGLNQRQRSHSVRPEDLAREAYMRQIFSEYQHQRVACVVGTFHAAALLGVEQQTNHNPSGSVPQQASQITKPVGAAPVQPKSGPTSEPGVQGSALLAYRFDLFDSRSGYPAGIRDPRWQQSVWESRLQLPQRGLAVARLAVELCRELRKQGHAAGSPDASEIVRVAQDLAGLRRLPCPGRREFLEAVESVLSHGELLGRGRALAKALQLTMVGSQMGRLAPGTPRSGLAPHVHQLLEALRLPKQEPNLRLDPFRSPLDRLRQVTLMRMARCGIHYATPRSSGPDQLTTVWNLDWNINSEATLEMAGTRGVTLVQVCLGCDRADEPLLERLTWAAEAGLPDLFQRCLAQVDQSFIQQANLSQIVQAVVLLDRVRQGQISGLPLEVETLSVKGIEPLAPYRLNFSSDSLMAAAERSLEGLLGSKEPRDVLALRQLLELCQPLGGRMLWLLERFLNEGSPLMHGAAAFAALRYQTKSNQELFPTLTSWFDAPESDRFKGALLMAATLLESSFELLDCFDRALKSMSEDDFYLGLPSLREGFEVLSPAARQRLLLALGADTSPLAAPPLLLAKFAVSNIRAQEYLTSLGLKIAPNPSSQGGAKSTDPPDPVRSWASRALPWELVLGMAREQMGGRAGRAARALDELYGAGHGEGSSLDQGVGAGHEPSFPSARDWAEELVEVFGEPVRQEVLGRAAERGRRAALLELNPDNVVPSVELLQQALSLQGGLAESSLSRLRKLVDRVIQQLVAQLSQTLQPALNGLSQPRPTRRAGGPLDLARTVRANLHRAQATDSGWTLAPEALFFKSRARRSLDLRIILVVDLSGSMEQSVIYSALMGAILAGLPAVSVHFVGFSTEVMDWSEHVSDPLRLLTEVQVGGGTYIAKGLRYARGLVKVPKRTLTILITDFEDAGPLDELLYEVESLKDAGVRPLGLAALSDSGQPRYCVATAEAVVAAGMPVAALTPLELADWVGQQIRVGHS
jgi:hypothetical protein